MRDVVCHAKKMLDRMPAARYFYPHIFDYMSDTPSFPAEITEALDAAEKANPNNFKHSDVRKIKRGLRVATEQIVELRGRIGVLSAIDAGRDMREEF